MKKNAIFRALFSTRGGRIELPLPASETSVLPLYYPLTTYFSLKPRPKCVSQVCLF